MANDRADVELTIQIGAEDDETILAILAKEARTVAKRLLARSPKAEEVEEFQWCSSAMRVTLRRPALEASTSEPQPATAWCPHPPCSQAFRESELRDGAVPYHDFPRPCRSVCQGSTQPPLREAPKPPSP